MLAQATVKARESGSRDVAAYLQLKSTNDAIRTTGVGWLFDTVIEIAAEINHRNSPLTIERTDSHRFEHGTSKLVGTAVHIRQGVRCLTVEAGWTRTPSDGIMRGGALAFARLSHFGMPKSGAELILMAGKPTPLWSVVGTLHAINSSELRRHFEIMTT